MHVSVHDHAVAKLPSKESNHTHAHTHARTLVHVLAPCHVHLIYKTIFAVNTFAVHMFVCKAAMVLRVHVHRVSKQARALAEGARGCFYASWASTKSIL